MGTEEGTGTRNGDVAPICGKRRFGDAGDMAFDLWFAQAATLQLLLDMCSPLIKEVQLEVEDTSDFHGVHLKTIDSKQVCMVIARLACDVRAMNGKCIFRVKTDTLSNCIKSLPSGYVARIYQHRDSDTIHLSSADTFDADAPELTFELPTLMTSDDNDICDRIQQMEYQYTVNIDCRDLQKFVRACKDNKLTEVTVEISSQSGEGGDDGIAGNYTFSLKASGDEVSNMERVFRSTPGCMVATGGCTDKGGAPDVVCSEKYFTAYLSHFLRCMDKGDATIQLSSQKPLLLTYSLDMRSSMVCFVLAPKDDD
jgi:hypothetical protein